MRNQLLRPLSSKRKIKFCVFDIETSKWVHQTLVGFYDGENYVHFNNVKDFLAFFLKKKYAFYKCFAHYGAGFDFNFILDAMDKYYPDYKMTILSNNGASMIKIHDFGKSNRTWTFVDSFRLLPDSLGELTKAFDVEHKKIELDRSKLDSLTREELIHYNKYDCKGHYEVLKKFEKWFEDFGVQLKTTTASQAMATFRQTMDFSVPLLSPKIESFIRSSYYGGRVEVFKMRSYDRLYFYDVRSLYPYVMKKYPMPVGSPKLVAKFYDDEIGFYRCNISIPEMYLPPLPHVIEHKLLFPIGNFSGVYSSTEIQLAEKLGCEIDIDYGYVFPSTYLFDKYIDKMYYYKENGNTATKKIGKLLLNSLYGKFGQNRKKQSLIRASGLASLGLVPYDESHALFSKESISKATFIIPSIASWITSCARTELMNWLLKAGEQNIYYCDTDSVCSTKQLPTGKNLGEMKLEYDANEGIFLLPKMYAIRTNDRTIIKAKGFERGFADKLTFTDFEDALHGNKSAFIQEVQRFGKFKEVLRREGQFIGMLTKKKSIQSEYSKRNIVENYDTVPVRV